MKYIVIITSLILVCSLFTSVNGSLSDTQTVPIYGQISYPAPPSEKYIAVLLISWNEWYFGRDPNWGDQALFTPELGSYLNDDPEVIEQQIKWMDEAGVDICFITIDYNEGVYWMNKFLSKAEALDSGVKFSAYFNGGNFREPTNRVLQEIQQLMINNIFDHPKYFKWEGTKPVVSGYLSKPDEGWRYEYWIETKQQYPSLSIWAHGWHPNYWGPLDGYVDAMIVLDGQKDAEGQADYYSSCETHPLLIHAVSITPGFDGTAIGREYGTLDRRNGQTFVDCWNMIPDLTPSPEVVFIVAWNEYGECSGIEPIIESRSTTTDAFGDLYLNLTNRYGNLYKSGEL